MNTVYKVYRVGPDAFKQECVSTTDYTVAEIYFREHCKNGLRSQKILLEKVACNAEVLQQFEFPTNVSLPDPRVT